MKKQTKTNKQTADSHNGCHRNNRPYSSSLSLGKVETDRVRDLERVSRRVCGWEPTLNRKHNKTHQNMSEWIITIPRHRSKEGGRRKARNGDEKWGDWWERCHTFQTFITLNKYLHMGTYTAQTHWSRVKLFILSLSVWQPPHTQTHTAAILISLFEFYCIPSPPTPTPLSIPSNSPHFKKICLCRGRLQSPVICLGKQQWVRTGSMALD